VRARRRRQQRHDGRADREQPDAVGDEERAVAIAQIPQRRRDREVRGRQQRRRQ
jgi:hypothetical protein